MAVEYFSDLNYSLANEDTLIEYTLLPQNAERVFSIAGSGARCLPLIAKNPETIDIVDMSVAQLYLVELRLAAMKSFTYEQYLFFMGYRGAVQDGSTQSNSRYELYKGLKLSKEATEYWDKNLEGWEKRGFLFLGRWETHFQKLGYLFREVLKCDFSKVFEAQSLSEQIELYEKHWPHARWKSFIRLAASEYVFNKFLYKGHFSGQEDRRTDSRPPHQFVLEEFERIFKTQLVRKNYFMQALFLGGLRYEEGLPLEAQRHIFEAVKAAKTVVHFHQGNLLEFLPKTAYSFISLSDTISYIDEKAASQILLNLAPNTPKSSTMVIRSFLRAPQEIKTTGWTRLAEEESWAKKTDGTGVYEFHLFRKD